MEGGEDDLNGMTEIIHYDELLLPLPQIQSKPHFQLCGHPNLIMAQELNTSRNEILDSGCTRKLYF